MWIQSCSGVGRHQPSTPRARRAGASPVGLKRGRDGTHYSRFHPSNFLAHHMARIVTAAVYADAEHICDGIIGLKQRALEFARAGDGADPPAA